MFKNLTIFRIVSDFFPELAAHEAELDATRFTPCLPSQEKSTGWVEPRGEANGALVESVAGQRILKLMIEAKTVPTAAIVGKAQEVADQIEATTGRKPGRKEMKELREDAKQALLPQAFPKRTAVWVWVDLKAGLVMLDATSQGLIDETVTALVRTSQGLSLALLQTNTTPQTAMTQWLATTTPEDDVPEDLSVERACVLKSSAEDKATVKFDHHHLGNEIVRKHITEGKLPVSLALSYAGRLAFVLTDTMRLKKITYLDGVFEGRNDADEAGFDTDVTLATGELALLIPYLVKVLGGELVIKAEEVRS